MQEGGRERKRHRERERQTTKTTLIGITCKETQIAKQQEEKNVYCAETNVNRQSTSFTLSSILKQFQLPLLTFLLGISSIYWTYWLDVNVILLNCSAASRHHSKRSKHPLTTQLCGETLMSLIACAVYHRHNRINKTCPSHEDKHRPIQFIQSFRAQNSITTTVTRRDFYTPHFQSTMK